MTDLYPKDAEHAAELMADMTRRESAELEREDREAASGNEQE